MIVEEARISTNDRWKNTNFVKGKQKKYKIRQKANEKSEICERAAEKTQISTDDREKRANFVKNPRKKHSV